MLAADDQAQPRPGLVDRAHLVVDEAGGQRDVADGLLDDVGRDARGFLGPRDPQAGGILHVRAARGDLLHELRARGDERDDHVELGLARQLRVVHRVRGVEREAGGRAEQRDVVAVLDAELLRQWRAGVTGLLLHCPESRPLGRTASGHFGHSTRWMMWMPKSVFTTPTSLTSSLSDSALNGGTRPASGVTS